MKSRRQFVKQGALAATAMMAANPFKAFSSVHQSILGSEYNHLVFLHTAESDFPFLSRTAGYIDNIKTASPGALLVHTGRYTPKSYQFDIPGTENRDNTDYYVIAKNGINTGVIFVEADQPDVAEKVNKLAAKLKKEKDCQMVVCISGLGFKNNQAMDDMKLAEASKNIDLIIGGHPDNYTANTRVARNAEKHEVVIQSSKSKERNCGKVEFSFDETGTKKHVHVATKLYKQVLTAS